VAASLPKAKHAAVIANTKSQAKAVWLFAILLVMK
jgi:hypothetical protein